MDKNYKKCYIAFLDLLGFKKLIIEENIDFLLQIFEKIKYSYAIAHQNLCNNEVLYRKINTKIISDSICLYIDASDTFNLILLIFTCTNIQWELLNLKVPIFVRGGIVKGDIYAEDDIIFGEGIINSYLLEEYNAKYPRIIMTSDILKPLDNKDLDGLVFRDFDGYYVADYFSRVLNYKKEIGLYEKIMTFSNNIIETITDVSLREKYNYVILNLLRRTENK